MSLHHIPDAALGARVVGWMTQESEHTEHGRIRCVGWWLGVWTQDGKWKEVNGGESPVEPGLLKRDYAMRVSKYLTKHVAEGGAWFAGWASDGARFYLLRKDRDGDIKNVLDCERPFHELLGWSMEDWAEHAAQVAHITRDWEERLELLPRQMKRHAQGEKVSTPNTI